MGIYWWMLVSLVLSLSAVLIYRFKNLYSGIFINSVRNLFLGILLLSLWSVINILKNMDILGGSEYQGIIFASEFLPELILATGFVFLGIGIILFYPALMLTLRKYNAFSSLSGLVNELNTDKSNKDTTDYIIKAVERIASHFDSDCYVLRQKQQNQSLKVYECFSCCVSNREKLTKKFEFRYSGRNLLSLSINISPLAYRAITDERMSIIENIISTNMKNIKNTHALENNLKTNLVRNKLFKYTSGSPGIADYLKRAFVLVNEIVDCDYISVSVVDNAIQNMRRYSYVNTGGQLLENGICYPLKQTIAQKTAQTRELYIANSLGSDFYRDDYHLYKSGFSSRLAYPLIDSCNNVLAILTLAAVKPRGFDQITGERLNVLRLPLCNLIEMQLVSGMMKDLRKQVISSFNLTFGLGEKKEIHDFYKQSARVISETLPVTMCRIWGYNRSTNRLSTLGLFDLRKDRVNIDTFENTDIEPELLPCHKNAMDMGKALIINQSNPENRMESSEIKTMGLPGIKSAILAPMKLRNRVNGIISVGETRNWDRRPLGPQELLFSQIISSVTAMVHEINESNDRLQKQSIKLNDLDRLSQVYSTYSNLPSKLASPMSAITCAAQILGKKIPPEANEFSRYNNMILKSSQTITNELEKFNSLKKNLLGTAAYYE